MADLHLAALVVDCAVLMLGTAAALLAWRSLKPRTGARMALMFGALLFLGTVHFFDILVGEIDLVPDAEARLLHRSLVLAGFTLLVAGFIAVTNELLRREEETQRAVEQAREADRRHARIAAIIEATTDFVGITDFMGNALYVNAAGRTMVGLDEDAEIAGSRIQDYHPHWAATVLEREGLPAALRDGVWTGETALRAGDGREIPVSQVILVHRAENGAVEYFSTIARDISERKHYEARLGRLASILEATPDVVATADMDGTLIYLNGSARSMAGLAEDETPAGINLMGFHPEWVRGILESDALPTALRVGSWTGDTAVATSDGREVATSQVVLVHRDSRGDPEFVSSVCRDISSLKAMEAQLRAQVLQDPLTRLANRTGFAEHLEAALRQANSTRTEVAVLFVDLDHFKAINDAFGHACGDALLVTVANRLLGCVRAGDTVARLGGDEFGILLEAPTEAEEAACVADRTVRALAAPFSIEGREILTRGSVGIAIGTGTDSAAELLRRADVAMYTAKTRGRNRFEVFDHDMQDAVGEHGQLLHDIDHAFHNGEFTVAYQPIVSLRTRQVLGVEALARWNHPRRGPIPPQQFIPLAEESGVIFLLGQQVMDEACTQARMWQETNRDRVPGSVTINVSARQLLQPGFVAGVRETLERSGLDPACLVLEVTESATMLDPDAAALLLGEIKALGIRLAMDDFGTGYSSLSHLGKFPFDILKIDRSFVEAMGPADGAPDLAPAIVRMGKSMRLEVIAEGIQTAAQAEKLLAVGCDAGQGYYFAGPLTAADMGALIRENRLRQEVA